MIVVIENAICIGYEPNKDHTTVAPPMKDKKTLRLSQMQNYRQGLSLYMRFDSHIRNSDQEVGQVDLIFGPPLKAEQWWAL